MDLEKTPVHQCGGQEQGAAGYILGGGGTGRSTRIICRLSHFSMVIWVIPPSLVLNPFIFPRPRPHICCTLSTAPHLRQHVLGQDVRKAGLPEVIGVDVDVVRPQVKVGRRDGSHLTSRHRKESGKR